MKGRGVYQQNLFLRLRKPLQPFLAMPDIHLYFYSFMSIFFSGTGKSFAELDTDQNRLNFGNKHQFVAGLIFWSTDGLGLKFSFDQIFGEGSTKGLKSPNSCITYLKTSLLSQIGREM